MLARGPSSWLGFGNLNNGTGNAGLGYLNGNNGLTNTNWNYLGRLSEQSHQRKQYRIRAAAKLRPDTLSVSRDRTPAQGFRKGSQNK